MLGTTFVGQRYDPRLKQRKFSNDFMSTAIAIPGSSTRYTTVPNGLTVGGSSTTASSLGRQISVYFPDHPSSQSHEDHSISISTGNSGFGYPTEYSNNAKIKDVASRNSVPISFRLPKLTCDGDTTFGEDTQRMVDSLSIAQVEAHIPNSSIVDECSEEASVNLEIREQSHILSRFPSVPNGHHRDGHSFTFGNRFRDSYSTAGFPNCLGSSHSDRNEDERHPDYASSILDTVPSSTPAEPLSEEDVDSIAPCDTIISTNTCGDTDSYTHSRRSPSTTSFPISPIVFRNRSSILRDVAVSCNNGQAELRTRVMPRSEGSGHWGDTKATPPLSSTRTVERPVWWRTILSRQRGCRQQQETGLKGGSHHGTSIPVVQERHASTPGRLAAPIGSRTDKPLPMPLPPVLVDDEHVQSQCHTRGLLSIIFPCLPCVVASGKQGSNESEKHSAKPSEYLATAAKAQDTIYGRVATRFRKRQRRCSPCTGDVGAERGQGDRTGMLEVKVEREISRTIDA